VDPGVTALPKRRSVVRTLRRVERISMVVVEGVEVVAER